MIGDSAAPPRTGENDDDDPRYFVAVFNHATWRMFLDAGGRIAGFREDAAGRVGRLRVGDQLLCYVVDRVGFVGMARVVGSRFESADTTIWNSRYFPQCIPVEVIVALPDGQSVTIPDLLDQLPRIRQATLKAPGAWGNFVRSAPRRWPPEEAEVVIQALRAKSETPRKGHTT